MRLLVMTRSDEKYRAISELTHPILQRFAEKWGAERLNWIKDHDDCVTQYGKMFGRMYHIYNLLDEYDRVLLLDSDIVINKTCPNLFEIVPEDKIGVVMEDVGSRLKERRFRISEIQKAWGNIGWIKDYFNAGVMLVSRRHRTIFGKSMKGRWEGLGYNQSDLGYHIHRLGLKYHKLHWKFNHMSMFSEKWNGSPSRFDSYIIHYAGFGRFPDKGKRSLEQLIKDDIKRIYG